MKFIYLLLFTNFYYVFCFTYLRLNNKFRQNRNVLFSNNNKYNNIYLNKNNSRVLQTSSYLETLEQRKSYDNKKFIKEISFDNIILYNNYIEAIYDNKKNFLIIEFKNNSRNVYYYINNYLHINTIIEKLNIDYINLNHYPMYITNTPFAFFVFEKNNN